MPHETYTGSKGKVYSGFKIDGNIQISFLKAIVVSYEYFEENIWENPFI
jgi:hypothetical protein